MLGAKGWTPACEGITPAFHDRPEDSRCDSSRRRLARSMKGPNLTFGVFNGNLVFLTNISPAKSFTS